MMKQPIAMLYIFALQAAQEALSNEGIEFTAFGFPIGNDLQSYTTQLQALLASGIQVPNPHTHTHERMQGSHQASHIKLSTIAGALDPQGISQDLPDVLEMQVVLDLLRIDGVGTLCTAMDAMDMGETSLIWIKPSPVVVCCSNICPRWTRRPSCQQRDWINYTNIKRCVFHACRNCCNITIIHGPGLALHWRTLCMAGWLWLRHCATTLLCRSATISCPCY